jgi:hypothetical protein
MAEKRTYALNENYYVDLEEVVAIEYSKKFNEILFQLKNGKTHTVRFSEAEVEKKWKDFITTWEKFKN